jgi:MFS family permease
MSNPSYETTRRTFRLEMWRSVPVGIIEFMFIPFAGLVALEFFRASDDQKAYLLAVAQIGLIGSLFIVPLVRHLGWSANGTGAVFNLFGAGGIALAALFPDSLAIYLVGLGFGMFAFMLPMPLMTQIYQSNFPHSRRGKLYATTTVFRGVVAVLFALVAGYYLKKDIGHFRELLWLFVVVATWAALIILRMPRVEVTAGSRNPFTAFRWLRDDKKFRVLIISWMMMGLGNLTALKLWVDYFANTEYGNNFDAWEVTLLTVVIPSVVKLSFTYPWGWLFDRLNFYFLRVILNCLFTIAVLVVFFGEGFWIIAIGTGLQGFAFAGGNIAWSLWVTKLAPPEHTAEYMSVHTFTTGLRGVAAPFIGFWLLGRFGSHGVALFCVGLMTLASIILIPEMRSIRARRRGQPITPSDPSS